jgi:hypothetical protein
MSVRGDWLCYFALLDCMNGAWARWHEVIPGCSLLGHLQSLPALTREVGSPFDPNSGCAGRRNRTRFAGRYGDMRNFGTELATPIPRGTATVSTRIACLGFRLSGHCSAV